MIVFYRDKVFRVKFIYDWLTFILSEIFSIHFMQDSLRMSYILHWAKFLVNLKFARLGFLVQ